MASLCIAIIYILYIRLANTIAGQLNSLCNKFCILNHFRKGSKEWQEITGIKRGKNADE